MRPKSQQLTATSVAQNIQLGPSLRELYIINDGNNNVFLDFDKEATTSSGFKLQPGATLSISFDFINLSYATDSGTSKLYMIKVLQ